jgi:actin-related protein 3
MENPELDFYIGDNCLDYRDTHNIIYPMSSGTVKDWEAMEKFWHRSLYYELKCDPENHFFVLTEPPMNPPENREQIAEIFFETFGVQGLYIGVQATLALYSNWFVAPSDSYQKKVGLTGTVLDSGDGVTHVIPVVSFVLANYNGSVMVLLLEAVSSISHWQEEISLNS